MPESSRRSMPPDEAVPPPPSDGRQSVGRTVPRARLGSDRTGLGPSLTQSVAPRTGVITVRGTVTAAGAHLVSDTVETLRRGGLRRVALHLDGAERIDEDGLAVLHGCQERIRAEGGALHIVGEPGPSTPDGP